MTHAAKPTHTRASERRPPAHHPRRKQTAMVGTRRMSVCSTGSTARAAGKSGTNKNAARAKARRAHPRSRGAGASFFVLLVIVAPADSDLVAWLDGRRTDLVLVQGDQIADDAIIEPERA